MTAYPSSPASLFSSHARPAGKYVYHYVLQNDQWNVFHQVNERIHYFICKFDTAVEAERYCTQRNGEVDHAG